MTVENIYGKVAPAMTRTSPKTAPGPGSASSRQLCVRKIKEEPIDREIKAEPKDIEIKAEPKDIEIKAEPLASTSAQADARDKELALARAEKTRVRSGVKTGVRKRTRKLRRQVWPNQTFTLNSESVLSPLPSTDATARTNQL